MGPGGFVVRRDVAHRSIDGPIPRIRRDLPTEERETQMTPRFGGPPVALLNWLWGIDGVSKSNSAGAPGAADGL